MRGRHTWVVLALFGATTLVVASAWAALAQQVTGSGTLSASGSGTANTNGNGNDNSSGNGNGNSGGNGNDNASAEVPSGTTSATIGGGNASFTSGDGLLTVQWVGGGDVLVSTSPSTSDSSIPA